LLFPSRPENHRPMISGTQLQLRQRRDCAEHERF